MSLIEHIKNDYILSTISTNFNNDVYLVGGAVRDFMLGNSTYDRDLIVCDADAKEFALKLADFFDAKFITLDEENKIYRVVFQDKLNILDITNPIQNSLELDLRRRDLTINAIAVNLNSFEVLDFSNGLQDIKDKKIKMILENNFDDDPLRLLRVFRFQANLGFGVDADTLDSISKRTDLISVPAVERVNYELLKMFSGKFVHLALVSADSCGLLHKIFPFVDELKQIPPNSHHHLDLFNHCVETVKNVSSLYESAQVDVKKHLENIDFGGFPRISYLRLVAFLHDIGKFSTWTIEADSGRHRFIKHDDVGAKLAVAYLKNLHFSNKQIDYISSLIKYHIYPSQIMDSEGLSDKVMMRFVRRMDMNSIDNIILAMADRLSARGPLISDEMVSNNINALHKLLKFYLKIRDSLKPLPKLLSGNDVMSELNIPPSPFLGSVLDALHEAQLNGTVISKEDAIRFIHNL